MPTVVGNNRFPPANYSNKILLALQYWDGDRAAGKRLAEFLADVETKHSDKADFLLVNRFDCRPLLEVVPTLSRKFNTFNHKSPRTNTGWPNGCNDLWFSTMEWAYFMIEAKRVPHYKAILTFEPDCCPLVPDWIARLSYEWDRVNKPKEICMAGALVQQPGEHINGNALITGNMNFLSWITKRVGGVMPGGGWDYVLAPLFKRTGWANIPGMRSLYNTSNYTEEKYEDLKAQDIFFVHGVKDSTLMDLGRPRMMIV